jgi:transcriptional regulator GlxA family with amidase domain
LRRDHQSTGVAPDAFVLSKRLAVARDLLLRQPTLSVADIASRVGFNSSGHMASLFRRHLVCSPEAFRRMVAR